MTGALEGLQEVYRECRRVQRTKVVGPSKLHGRPAEYRAWEQARYHTAKELAEFVRALIAKESAP